MLLREDTISSYRQREFVDRLGVSVRSGRMYSANGSYLQYSGDGHDCILFPCLDHSVLNGKTVAGSHTEVYQESPNKISFATKRHGINDLRNRERRSGCFSRYKGGSRTHGEAGLSQVLGMIIICKHRKFLKAQRRSPKRAIHDRIQKIEERPGQIRRSLMWSGLGRILRFQRVREM